MQASGSGAHYSKHCRKCFDVKPMTDFDKAVFFTFGIMAATTESERMSIKKRPPTADEIALKDAIYDMQVERDKLPDDLKAQAAVLKQAREMVSSKSFSISRSRRSRPKKLDTREGNG